MRSSRSFRVDIRLSSDHSRLVAPHKKADWNMHENAWGKSSIFPIHGTGKAKNQEGVGLLARFWGVWGAQLFKSSMFAPVQNRHFHGLKRSAWILPQCFWSLDLGYLANRLPCVSILFVIWNNRQHNATFGQRGCMQISYVTCFRGGTEKNTNTASLFRPNIVSLKEKW